MQVYLAEFNSCSAHRSGFALVLKKQKYKSSVVCCRGLGQRNEFEDYVGTRSKLEKQQLSWVQISFFL